MPAVSPRQQKFMALCANNPEKARGKCPSKAVAKEFSHFEGASPHTSWLEAHYARHGLGEIPQAVAASPKAKAMEGKLTAMQRRMALGG